MENKYTNKVVYIFTDIFFVRLIPWRGKIRKQRNLRNTQVLNDLMLHLINETISRYTIRFIKTNAAKANKKWNQMSIKSAIFFILITDFLVLE